jgi:hypothetical protein
MTMIIDQGAQPCANRNCSCEVPAGQTYCSPECANASVESVAAERSGCGCGHHGCGVEAVPHETDSRAEI